MISEPQTFFFLGRSGCGKGTQAALMKNYLKAEDKRKIVYLEMGDLFRKLWKEEGYTNSRSKKIMAAGDLQPAFIQIYLWTSFLMKNMRGNEHLIIDGTPRRLTDAEAIDSALKFYGRAKPHFVFLNVSRNWAKDKILARIKSSGREEDRLGTKIVESRLDWYEKFVEPSINFFRGNPFYNFVEVRGEQSINDVHKEILQKTNL